MVKIAVVVGARPNFMKAVPIWNSLCSRLPIEQLFFIHTGQHYSHSLSQVFIDELKLNINNIIYLDKYSNESYPKNSVVRGMSWIIRNLSDLFIKEKIDKVIVFGDVNSTLAAGLAAAMNDLFLIHIESGLRSYNMKMPEERNRVLVDKMSDLLFTTEFSAKDNLSKEGINKGVHHCGNTMIDTLSKYMSKIKYSNHYLNFKVERLKYVVFTLHRQENVENKKLLEKVILNVKKLLIKLGSEHKILFITHPRTVIRLKDFNINTDGIDMIKSQCYFHMLNLVYNCGILLTDSGGLQEESAYLGVPCVTLRENTERPVTVTKGYNSIIQPASDTFNIDFMADVFKKYGKRKDDLQELVKEMGDGKSSDKIVDLILGVSFD